jgi:hypothetical protein
MTLEEELEGLRAELSALRTKLDKLREDFNSPRWNDADATYRRTLLDQEHYMSGYASCLRNRISQLTEIT